MTRQQQAAQMLPASFLIQACKVAFPRARPLAGMPGFKPPPPPGAPPVKKE